MTCKHKDAKIVDRTRVSPTEVEVEKYCQICGLSWKQPHNHEWHPVKPTPEGKHREACDMCGSKREVDKQ